MNIDHDGSPSSSMGFGSASHQVGDGPAVVLLHGYVGDGAATWQRQLDALSDEFRLIAWDAPGAGASTDPPESFGMAGYADCLAGFIAALGVERRHTSSGCPSAARSRSPSPLDTRALARSLVVVSGYAGWGGSLPPDVVDQRLPQALALSALTADEFVDALLPTMFATMPAADDVDRFAASMRAFHPAGFPCDGPGVGRGSARALGEHRRADTAGVRRSGCPGAAPGGRAPPQRHRRVRAHRPARPRPCLQPRTPRRVQHRRQQLPAPATRSITGSDAVVRSMVRAVG